MNKVRKEICKFKCKTTGEEIIFTVAYVEGKLDTEYKIKILRDFLEINIL